MRQVASQLRSKAFADSLWGFKLLWKHVKVAPKCSHHSKMLHLCKNMDLQSQSATVISHDISQCVTHMHSSLKLSINQEHCLFMAAISQIGLYKIRHPFQFVQCLRQSWQYQSMATIFCATTAAANTLDDPQTLQHNHNRARTDLETLFLVNTSGQIRIMLPGTFCTCNMSRNRTNQMQWYVP